MSSPQAQNEERLLLLLDAARQRNAEMANDFDEMQTSLQISSASLQRATDIIAAQQEKMTFLHAELDEARDNEVHEE
tara:strand:+ start:457 stop:687 length:231 start_codon:yes stop_codon:yes gene_type:complete